MAKYLLIFLVLFAAIIAASHLNAGSLLAQKNETSQPVISITPSPYASAIPTPLVRLDLTQRSTSTEEPLLELIKNSQIGEFWLNPLKHVIFRSVLNGVPTNTLVLLLLLPTIALIVASARHLIGLQGFGILLPAALGVTFLAVGPIVGLTLFLVITFGSSLTRIVLRRVKLRLHYLPRMSFLLGITTLIVLIVLFLVSFVDLYGVQNVSIFPVLFLILLSEDFTRVQIGKSLRTAFNMTTQTLFLAIVLYTVLTQEGLHAFVVTNPEIAILAPLALSVLLGKFSGLRFLEYYRFRRLLKS